MAIQRTTRKAGFTLIELMIVVAIIGLLASVAIPTFRVYQLRSKRAEAYANLSSLAKSQKSYFAEFGDYIGVLSEPLGLTGQVPGTDKRSSLGWNTTGFARVGWIPEGDVFFDYDTNTADFGCVCVACFTAAAYGDLDGDTGLSVLVYAEPDISGNNCPTGLAGTAVPVDGGGRLLFSQVAWSSATDKF